jgi:Zn-dependent protease with chaperone function
MTTGYVVHGVLLALAWFGVANIVSSAAVAAGSMWLAGAAQERTPRWWLTLRCLPAAASLLFVVAVFVPSYVRFEPREAAEGFDVTLTICAAIALAIVAAALFRGIRAWRRARRQSAVWMRSAQPLASYPVQAFSIGPAPAPLMALAGIAAPRLFVSERLLNALTAEELDATLAHELAHARSRDNLKRLLMRTLPDALAGTPFAGALERGWASASEHAADLRATGGDPAARCALAAALVKVARLMPVPVPPLEPISTLVGGGDLASRIESLLNEPAAPRRSTSLGWTAAAAVLAAIAYAPLIVAVHEITEVLVNSLP